MAEASLAHMVYFTLKDAGVRGTEFQRPVNNQEYHVALNVVFDNKDSHDKYQEAADHLTFISENKDKWANVQIFDSYVTS